MKTSQALQFLTYVAAIGFGLMFLFLFAELALAKTTVTSHTDSVGYTHSTINDGKRSTHCTTHTDSVHVTHTSCN